MVLQYILQQFCMPQNNPLPAVIPHAFLQVDAHLRMVAALIWPFSYCFFSGTTHTGILTSQSSAIIIIGV